MRSNHLAETADQSFIKCLNLRYRQSRESLADLVRQHKAEPFNIFLNGRDHPPRRFALSGGENDLQAAAEIDRIHAGTITRSATPLARCDGPEMESGGKRKP